jgi:hypothetical protein
MTLAKAKAKTNKTFIVQASLTIVTYDHQNMFIVQATDVKRRTRTGTVVTPEGIQAGGRRSNIGM